MGDAPWTRKQGVNAVLARWAASAWIQPCFCADTMVAATGGRFGPLPENVSPAISAALRARGINPLYRHQAEAIEAALRGRHVVVATPTASGKSLCFHVPVLEAMSRDPNACALYLYPTKALARDQEAALAELVEASRVPGGGAVVYDGDTPPDRRRAARERSRIVLTNPDMLHSGILPHHTSWARTLRNLRYVIADELHTYKGVFGSHVANVLRRLIRAAAFHGAHPRFLGATATIANPRAHAARLFGVAEEDLSLVEQSGAPRGSRRFFLFNPPVVHEELGIRASYLKQSVMLAADLLRARVPTLVFGHSRNAVEVMLRYLREAVATTSSRTDRGAGVDASQIVAYRGGYLPAERRDIERRLRDGEILGVVATSALELGIDIGSLDAVVCAGYPGSIAATWQRFGRAGRRHGESVCVLVASSAPVDQYLAREPAFFLGAPVEEARIDPDNVEILVQHVKCAAFELPFQKGEAFGSLGPSETAEALTFLARHRVLHESGDAYHWAADAYPANDVSLRSASWDNVVIIDVAGDRSIGELDWRSAHTMLHEQAIYQHDGECWQVERFDHPNHKAFVRRVDPDYWTTAMTHVQVAILETTARGSVGAAHWTSGWGEVAVVEKVVGYKKIKFHTHENAGYGDVRLPEMNMHTTSWWLSTPALSPAGGGAVPSIPERGGESDRVVEGLLGVGVALETVATVALMCDPHDLGTTLGDAGGRDEDGSAQSLPRAPPFGYRPTLFVFERVPGGTGLAQRIWEQREVLLDRAARMIERCPCREGCPACVGPAAVNRKHAALELLRSARLSRSEERAQSDASAPT